MTTLEPEPSSRAVRPETPTKTASQQDSPSGASEGDAAQGGELSSAIYVRTDTDQTQIISPQVHFRASLGASGTNVDIVYIADIWTSASVDIRTAATKVVREQRDEIDVGFDRTRGTTVVGLGYRYSHEVDYTSHALSLSLKHEAFQRNTSFDARVFASSDKVSRSGDSEFSKDLVSTGLWLGMSQVLGKRSLAQVSVESRLASGYMASPYRYVGVGAVGTCASQSSTCLPEVHPSVKARYAAVARWRFALTERLSTGLAYRFYYDNWKIQSHTVLADFAVQILDELVFALGYRGYTQGSTFFYKPIYGTVDDGSYITRDRELSALNNHQVTARVELRRPVLSRATDLVLGLLVGQTYYRYKEFRQLDRVRATEVSANVGVEF